MPHALVSRQHRKNAKSMRRAMTDAELKLWNELRAHRLMGLSFRRQVPIAGYIADVDEERRRRIEQDGWTILRFWNDDILRDIDNVCRHIVISAGLDTPEEAGGLIHQEVLS